MARKTYTEQDKQRVRDLTEIGISDTEITKITGFSYNMVQLATTRYWKNKMLNKREE